MQYSVALSTPLIFQVITSSPLLTIEIAVNHIFHSSRYVILKFTIPVLEIYKDLQFTSNCIVKF